MMYLRESLLPTFSVYLVESTGDGFTVMVEEDAVSFSSVKRNKQRDEDKSKPDFDEKRHLTKYSSHLLLLFCTMMDDLFPKL